MFLGQKQANNRDGFTIVELLIVVVVIAILAAITIVAYNGITKKAQYTSNVVTAKQYVSVLQLYKAQTGSYPYSGGASMVGYCLGKGYPTNYDADPSGDCINDLDFDDFNFNESTTFNALIEPYFPQLPTVQQTGFVAGGHRFNGINYMYDPNISLDNAWAARSILFYYLQGQNQDCQIPVVRYTGNGTGHNSSNPGGSDYVFSSTNPNKWTYVNQYATACVYILPD